MNKKQKALVQLAKNSFIGLNAYNKTFKQHLRMTKRIFGRYNIEKIKKYNKNWTGSKDWIIL